MGWVLRLVETGINGSSRSVDVMALDCPSDLSDIADLGLTLAQGSCAPTAGMPNLHHPLPRQGLGVDPK
jgi:hypothetical protein